MRQDTRWSLVADGLGFTEGPVGLPDGRVAVASISHGAVHLVDREGRVETRRTGGGPNGLAVAPDGTLYVAQNGGIWGAPAAAEPGVQVLSPDGGPVEQLVGRAAGLESPNDLALGPDGRLWVTDTRGEVDWTDPARTPPGRVWAVEPSTGVAELVLPEAPRFVNGIGFTADRAGLLLTATLSATLWHHPVRQEGGALRPGAGRVVHRFDTGHPDGLAVAPDGVWVALTSGDRVDVVDAAGGLVARRPVPRGSLPTNVCVSDAGPAGERRSEVYLTAARAGALLRLPAPWLP